MSVISDINIFAAQISDIPNREIFYNFASWYGQRYPIFFPIKIFESIVS